jgi:hypothetical protein
MGVFVERFFVPVCLMFRIPASRVSPALECVRSRTKCITHGQFAVGQLLSAEKKKVTHRNFISKRYLDSEKRWVNYFF